MCCYELWDGIISSSFTNDATVSPWLKEGIKEALKLPHCVFQPSLPTGGRARGFFLSAGSFTFLLPSASL